MAQSGTPADWINLPSLFLLHFVSTQFEDVSILCYLFFCLEASSMGHYARPRLSQLEKLPGCHQGASQWISPQYVQAPSCSHLIFHFETSWGALLFWRLNRHPSWLPSPGFLVNFCWMYWVPGLVFCSVCICVSIYPLFVLLPWVYLINLLIQNPKCGFWPYRRPLQLAFISAVISIQIKFGPANLVRFFISLVNLQSEGHLLLWAYFYHFLLFAFYLWV